MPFGGCLLKFGVVGICIAARIIATAEPPTSMSTPTGRMPFNRVLAKIRGYGRMLSAPTGAMCKMFRPVAVYRLGTATGLFIIQGVQVRRRRGIQSITACPPSPGPGDRRSAPHRPSCGCAVPHRKVWQAYCRLHLEADMHRFLAIFALSIR